MRSPVWTIEEIHALPEFGGKVGWFYGLIRWEGKIHLGEIFPGLGFTRAVDRYNWYSPWVWRHIVKDVWWAARRGRALAQAPLTLPK